MCAVWNTISFGNWAGWKEKTAVISSTLCFVAGVKKRPKSSKVTMSQPISRSRFYQCDRKFLFVSQTEATSRAESIRAKGGPAMRPYHCPHCNGWHLARVKAGAEPLPFTAANGDCRPVGRAENRD